MKIQPLDVKLMIGAGTFIGVFLILLFHGKDRKHLRKNVQKWCLRIGIISSILMLSLYLQVLDFIARRALFFMLVGFPALSTGLTLLAYEKLLSRYEKKS